MTIPKVALPDVAIAHPLISTLTSSPLAPVSGIVTSVLGGVGFLVDSLLNPAVEKVYNLKGGLIELDFTLGSGLNLLSSISVDASVVITIDKKPVAKVLATELGKSVKVSVPFRLKAGQHVIGFKAEKGSNLLSRAAFLISKLVVYEKQIFPIWSGDLLINGGF